MPLSPDSYGYRNIGDVLQLQEQRLHMLQQQSTAASGPSSSSAVFPTPQKTVEKGKGTQKKQSPVEKSKEIAQPKRKEVESAIGPSSEKPRSRRLRIESD